MKIGQTPDIPSSVASTVSNAAQKAAQNNPAATAAAATAAKDSRSAGVAVTVSTLARSLEKPIGSESADVDAKKVASVKAAIEDGTYVVNAEAIADQLLSNAQEMLNRTTR
ncbi:flagellar biosynthesis anti-sigma factor FlgM [uncultured Rhodoferax sp.]|uniref:flagellar biosynthesis anti-sigma factor FlgM n=1 Tax=uncultured Rhodoferax sp. TaxID=223188 RepID=UPI0025D95D2E|nr:flagellar biosynthesis anti-sigma factor FlgM [uncultured Rhodoferax sp.]